MAAVGAIINFIHLSSITAWIGAILFISIIVGPIFKSKQIEASGDMLESIFRRFKLLSIICIILMIISGILLTGKEGAAAISISSTYGVLFLFKHILMVVIAGAIFISKYYLFPKIKKLCNFNEDRRILCKYQQIMLAVLYISSAFGFGVLLITAFMQVI